ncbi:uncharacterized protein RCC_07866 [Ramularia collo-cygni]|uniref:RRP15 Essential protein involved in pre-rRNA processing n=1 Tax=Ramularia collo-cygni TaxID=112498 RepID=A0A2D3VB09_9PEZI|nr:uncharacterized protein RCC_07866 [Ramularia collo-cygni]CZT21997.1 uncharacterized protein RCC_07866 [Ramularia collo-cygni]
MPPAPQKRRRNGEGEERRPKKKVRKVKKQTDYHSSSEESDADDGLAINVQRASDAPKGWPKHVKEAVKPAGGNAEPLGKRGAAQEAMAAKKAKAEPKKSILKAVPQKVEEVEEESEDEENDGVKVDELEKNTALNTFPGEGEDSDDEIDDDELELDDDEPDLDASSSDDDSDAPSETESATSMTSSQAARNKKKRNDPTAFATSISKILDTKLSTAKRSDPVLSRSKSAAEANKTLADQKLEGKARAQIRAERVAAREKGRVKDVLGVETEGVDTGAVMELEKKLKKTAQRGVVRLFNAVRAAQVQGEKARIHAANTGVVGMAKREERVNEMSKQGFLDLISSGGKVVEA